FQAEDGIRDRTVTGVQTCALPISPKKVLFTPVLFRLPAPCPTKELFSPLVLATPADVPKNEFWPPFTVACPALAPKNALLDAKRSEERRVGKELRRAWCRQR